MKRRLLCLLLCFVMILGTFPLDVFAVESVIVETFNIAFQSGADLRSGKYIWNPSDPASGHMFVYRLDYSVSGVFSQEKGALRFELPLHILKDRGGNWADTFDCPYKLESAVADGDDPEFVYKIEGDKVVIYNYKPYISGKAGYIEFAYVTNKLTMDYVDMSMSTTVEGDLKVKSSNGSVVTKHASAPAVGIDTHAVLDSVEKSVPELFKTWQSSWGDSVKPVDADNWVYLIWTVTSDIGKNTQPYSFSISDSFSSLGGSVVGYRFQGSSQFGSITSISNQRIYGKRYDWVLTKHSKAQAQALLASSKRYEVMNNVTCTVTPMDKIDPPTTKSGYRDYWVEAPVYTSPTGHFWSEKYGIYGGLRQVRDSEDISNYMLEEFQYGDIDKLDELKYYVYLLGYPYPWTVGAGADGTVNDALNGLFGQKKVDYVLTDDQFFIENDVALSPDDYDIMGLVWSVTMRDARFDTDDLKFVECGISTFSPDDGLTIQAKVNGSWVAVCKYDMATKTYSDVDTTWVKSARGTNLVFNPGVKGYKISCSNAYYKTQINAYPSLTLYRTDTVLNNYKDKMKVSATNRAVGTVSQNGSDLFSRTVDGTDYICRADKDSEIKKQILQTRNDRVREEFTISWQSVVHEDILGDKIKGVVQQSGKFFDLLPVGGLIDKSSIVVKASNGVLSEGSYELDFVENYKNSGRTLMIVDIKEPTNQYYELVYTTVHSWQSIKDYGKHVVNSVMYESGNKRFTDGLPNDGGDITDKSWLNGTGDRNEDVHLFAEARYSFDILTAGSTGLMKQVRGPMDSAYVYDTWVNQGGNYVYNVRHENDTISKCKDMVFFDSLESFYQRDTDTTETIVSEWKGVLQSVNTQQMTAKGVRPVIYLSKIDRMNPYGHHDLNEVQNGEKVWIEYSEFARKYGVESAHAIAVDARTAAGGGEFVLNEGDSLVFQVYMKAPDENVSGKLEPITYNNIFIERSIMKNLDGSSTGYVSQFFHQDYTQVRFRMTGDVSLRKVDKVDMESPVSGAVFTLTGDSGYGNHVELERVSDKSGNVVFKDVESGSYLLQEIECDPDWQLNKNTWTVVIDENGQVTMDCVQDKNGAYLISNEPRIHGDLLMYKLDAMTKERLNGAMFRLTGTSAYGNDILMYAESANVGGRQGRVEFRNLEMGSYSLVETDSPEGYAVDRRGWIVNVDERGVVTLLQNDVEVETDDFGVYLVYNCQAYTVRFLKSSSYGEGMYLEGAEFELSGFSDTGEEVFLTATSSGSDDGGLVEFRGIQPGTYSLKETKAPDGHVLDTTNHVVVVNTDGTYEISGIGLTEFMGSEIYDYKNLKESGELVVRKVWKDDLTNNERVVPDISISTTFPKKSLLGTTVTFNANGGRFQNGKATNDVVYNSEGSIVVGSFMDLTTTVDDFRIFQGWYTDSVGGKKVTVDASGVPAVSLTEDTVLYAHWTLSVRYAVSVWDICVDEDENGNTMGLTFGPSVGVDYDTNVPISHEASGDTADGNPHRCIHNDSWETIIDWNHKDPYVYEDCVMNKCTKAVPLKGVITGPSGVNFYISYDTHCTGDGTSGFRTQIQKGSKFDMDSSFGGESGMSSYGGWGASRLRAVMNGADSLTQPSMADNSNRVVSATWYTEDISVLGCFPELLRNAIGKRKVTYFAKTVTWQHPSDLRVSYDKLWVPSINELCTAADDNNTSVDFSDEGFCYQRFMGVGNVKTYTDNAMSEHVGRLVEGNCWLYTRSVAADTTVWGINSNASLVHFSLGGQYYISPCFTLSR